MCTTWNLNSPSWCSHRTHCPHTQNHISKLQRLCAISNLQFAVEGSQQKDMTVKYRQWVVSLNENVDNGDDYEHRYSHYGYHYLGLYPSYGGNVLDISNDPYGYVSACMYVCIYVGKCMHVYSNPICMTFVCKWNGKGGLDVHKLKLLPLPFGFDQ